MAYETTNPPICIVPRMGGGPAVWYYKDDDPHTDVDASDYFTDALELGMKDNDIVIVVDEDTGTTTLHHVTGVDADGNGTVSLATLS